jgi:hypothetical protein
MRAIFERECVQAVWQVERFINDHWPDVLKSVCAGQ